MADIFDYIKWRGDISLEAVPLCDGDRLILSELVYLDFGVYEPVSLRELCRGMLNRIFVVRESGAKWEKMLHHNKDEELLRAVMNCSRFADIKVGYFEERTDRKTEEQFAAMTAFLPNSTAIVLFRGTDWSLIGWKEDFSMTWCDELPSQKSAVSYLEKIAALHDGPIELAGHSKGGNLAVYAGAFCGGDISDRITRITNLDGPGFNERVSESPRYLSIIGKVINFMPHSSIVGELFSAKGNYRVVKSRGIGPMQHITYNWELDGGEFVTAERDLTGKRIDSALNKWITSMENDERKRFIETVWSIIDKADIVELGDLIDGKNAKSFITKYRSMDKASRDFIRLTLSKLHEFTRDEFTGKKEK